MTEIVPGAAPALGMSLSVEIGKGRNLVFQSHVDRDCELEVVNDFLDKINAAADRQMAKCAVEELRHRYNNQKMVLQQLTTDFYKIEEREADAERKWNADPRRHGQWKRSEREEQHRAQIKTTMERVNAETEELKRMLDEAEKAAI